MADTASDPTSDAQLREEVAAWLAANWDPSIRAHMRAEGGYGGELGPYSTWLAKVVEARWAVPRWQTAWFGRGLKDGQARIIEREFARVGAPGAGQDRTNLWANTLTMRAAYSSAGAPGDCREHPPSTASTRAQETTRVVTVLQRLMPAALRETTRSVWRNVPGAVLTFARLAYRRGGSSAD